MLTARTETEPYVEAALATKGVAYLCRGCGAPAILHAGRIRVRHFAHRPNARCAFGARMSLAHLAAQQQIAAALRARGVTAELESWLPGLAGDRRIDVLAHPPERPGRRIAIEVQQADLTDAAIEARTRSYQAQDVAPLWLRLLDFARFERVQALPFSGEVWIDRYAARSWERWAHDRFGQQLWFCDSGTSRLWRGRFLPAYSWRDGSEWYEPGGIYNSTPGGFQPVSRWVGLALQGPFLAADLRLQRGRLADGGLAAWFVAPDDPPARAPPPFGLRQELRWERHMQVHVVEQLIDGHWVPALFEGAAADWRTVPQPRRKPVLPQRSCGPVDVWTRGSADRFICPQAAQAARVPGRSCSASGRRWV